MIFCVLGLQHVLEIDGEKLLHLFEQSFKSRKKHQYLALFLSTVTLFQGHQQVHFITDNTLEKDIQTGFTMEGEKQTTQKCSTKHKSDQMEKPHCLNVLHMSQKNALRWSHNSYFSTSLFKQPHQGPFYQLYLQTKEEIFLYQAQIDDYHIKLSCCCGVVVCFFFNTRILVTFHPVFVKVGVSLLQDKIIINLLLKRQLTRATKSLANLSQGKAEWILISSGGLDIGNIGSCPECHQKE